MADEKEYYQYIPDYNNYESVENNDNSGILNRHPIYKNIPYYNNEIKSLVDKTDNYSDNVDNIYYKDESQNAVNNDPNLIYNDGYPSYRMVNTPNPRIVEISRNNKRANSQSTSSMGSASNHSSKTSEISKLTDAIKELTSRLPAPPTPELLRSVHPNLAVKLQLTYLKAYIQNQQLLMDLKSKFDKGYSSDFAKYTSNGVSDPQNMGSDQYPIVELRSGYPQLTNPAMSSDPNFNSNLLNFGYANEFLDYIQNAQMNQMNCPQLTNYPNVHYPLVPQPNYNLPQLTDQPQTNYPQLTDYPQGGDTQSYQYTNGNYENSNYDSRYKEEDEEEQYNRNPALLLPEEYKDRVKYNPAKKAFVSVFYNSLGIRRRKSFSINKFGIRNALKLAINFSNQPHAKGNGKILKSHNDQDMGSSDYDNQTINLATKERSLVEKVCEHALSVNSNICEEFELFERALLFDLVRGLVYSLGSNLWICIYYKNGRRMFQCFKVDEFGFEKCYQMGRSFFENNPKVMRSKLSGVLSYWLDTLPTKTLVIIFKLGSGSYDSFIDDKDLEYESLNSNKSIGLKSKIQKRNDSSRIFLGRFELDLYGGFLRARKASQDWFQQVKNSQMNGTVATSRKTRSSSDSGQKSTADKDADPASDMFKLGFVYYDHFSRLWIVVAKNQSYRFSADSLGYLEAKKQALTLRQQHIISNKINLM